MKKTRFTKEGYENIQKEYKELLASRPEAVLDLKKARELGDLSENGYYKAARMKLSSIDGRLFRMKLAIRQAVIIDDSDSRGVTVGKQVVLQNGEKEVAYKIVGDLEANPAEGKISLLSPLGRAVEGKGVGEIVEAGTPSGLVRYTIKSVS
jgi:transcription elongation factor GreA